MKNSYRLTFTANGTFNTINIDEIDFINAINQFYRQFPNGELFEIKRTFNIN